MGGLSEWELRTLGPSKLLQSNWIQRIGVLICLLDLFNLLDVFVSANYISIKE